LVALTARGANLAPQCAAALEETGFGIEGLSDRDLDALAATITSLREASGDWQAGDAVRRLL